MRVNFILGYIDFLTLLTNILIILKKANMPIVYGLSDEMVSYIEKIYCNQEYIIK